MVFIFFYISWYEICLDFLLVFPLKAEMLFWALLKLEIWNWSFMVVVYMAVFVACLVLFAAISNGKFGGNFSIFIVWIYLWRNVCSLDVWKMIPIFWILGCGFWGFKLEVWIGLVFFWRLGFSVLQLDWLMVCFLILCFLLMCLLDCFLWL